MNLGEQIKRTVELLLGLCNESHDLQKIRLPEAFLIENGIAIQTFLHIIAPKIKEETGSVLSTATIAYAPGGEYIFSLNKDGLEEYSKKLNLGSKSKNIKEVIKIDSKRGIYREDDPKKKYEIRGERKSIVMKLKSGTLSLNDLTAKNRNKALISQEIGKVNESFKSKLNLKKDSPDLIKHSDSSGYYLNDDDYSIEFN